MTGQADIHVTYRRFGSRGEAMISVAFTDGSIHTDSINVVKESARTALVAALCEGREGVPRDDIAAELDRIAAEVAGLALDDGAADESDAVADRLVAIAMREGVALSHTPGGLDSEGFACFEVNGHRETRAVKSRGFTRWLQKEYLGQYGKAPNEQAMRTATGTIEAFAICEADEEEVFVRVAGVGDDVWLDLADDQWRCVRITSSGWEIVESDDSPVRFVRTGSALPLPAPERGGDLKGLRDLLNLQLDDDWILFIGWLVMTLHPVGDYPVLAVNGEEGSAKSTLCRLGRCVVDPNRADLRRPPREELDLVIAANNAWVVGFDNFSGLSQRLSDAVSCLSTGSGFSTRTLYTTSDETIISVKRPVVLNGIPDVVTSGDLASRSVNLTLPAIEKEDRRARAEIDLKFEAVWPGVLGALLDAVSCALRRQSQVAIDGLARMADFCLWVTAAEPALGIADGAFMAAYERRLADAVENVIEASPIGPVLLRLLRHEEPWTGTATALLRDLNRARGEERISGWPTSGQKAGNALRRLAPSLRRVGIDVREPKKGDNPRLYTIGPLPGESGQSAGSEAQARQSAGSTPQGDPKKADSRASALPAHSSGPSEPGEQDAARREWERGFGWTA